MVNGAFFIPSGGGAGCSYAKASSVEPKSAALVEQLTMKAAWWQQQEKMVAAIDWMEHCRVQQETSILLATEPVAAAVAKSFGAAKNLL
ncbi:hypothetical protein MKW98_009884 [Papaver atlanticum]|uniref:Uncharacterized protein n=1 Tax=Papaver atlanticum TaxID=357466 RepID=A0AAD4XDP4_9MAGN|nr:hypothetical protein MKW98_009884 [Papaver atlanticum]